ncbi:GAS2-like protein 3 isoform X1 [Cydia strobilella]|uniref:GAS2-like protein 3 isoform X1 n=1 Tax=Cydia strobilella TaxID=1100964 RepID=UPI003003E6A8
MAYYRCGPTTIGSRASWGPSSPSVDPKAFDRPLSGTFDRIFNAFERSNAFEYVNTQDGKETRSVEHGEVVVNRKKSSSYERADSALAAQTPSAEDEDYYREKILYSQARQLFPLQEDLADWINKTIGITYLTGENFLDALDNGAELCQLASVIHERAREALDQGLFVGPVPAVRGRCWQRAARRSFFSRDNADNFLSFCRDLGVHENLLFESDDLVLHNQPRQVVLCLLEVARLATRFGLEPPGLVAFEREIAAEERDSGLDSAMSGAWQFRDNSPGPEKTKSVPPPSSPEPHEMSTQTEVSEELVPDGVDAESTRSGGSLESGDSDVPLRPTNELDKRVQLVTRLLERGCRCGAGRCSRLLKVKKVGEGRYNIAGRNVFIRLLKGRHMMVRVGGGWDTLEHFLSRHEPCQVRLVTQGRRDVLPVPPDPDSGIDEDRKLSPIPRKSVSPASSKASLKESLGTVSPVSKASSGASPDRSGTRASSKASSGKSSPIHERTSTPKPTRPRPNLTLPLKTDARRKQSLPSTPSRSVKTPPVEHRKSLGSVNVPKKSRSMSLALAPEKPFCGTERLNARKASSAATTPTAGPRQTRSQSLASTPVHDPKKTFCGTEKLNATKKTRSMSLAATAPVARPLQKAQSAAPVGGFTQAAIEESIRLSLAASISDSCSTKKPFLHIKAKYRSPPPREVPPR